MQYEIPKNAKILKIEEIDGYKLSSYDYGEGLRIITDKGDIVLVISSGQSCCESFGGDFLETPDDINKYIGAKILKIKDTNDSQLNEYHDCGGEPQLKIITDKGVLQYAVYNDHNGYYSHATFLQVFDITENGGL